jgi:hypothetical protein
VTNDLSKAVERATSDQSYRAKLRRDPEAALQEVGVDMPDGVEVKVVENEAAIVYLVLPEQPDDDLGLTAEELKRVAGGFTAKQLASFLKMSGTRH